MLAKTASRVVLSGGALKRSAGALVAGSIMAAALAAPAMAAPRPLTMDVYLAQPCVEGFAKPNTTIKVVIRSSTDIVKGRDAFLSGPDGSWFTCTTFDDVATGDHIKVIDYDTHQTLNYTVPRVTVTVNRTTDVVSGTAPAGMHLTLEAADFNAPLYGKDSFDVIKNVTATGGVYSHDFGNNGADLMTGSQVEVRASGAGGAVELHRDLIVPGIFVIEGDSALEGYMLPYEHIGVTLKVGGVQVARGDGVADDTASFETKFVDADDDPYVVQGGEKLSAPALGISWTVPQINGTANAATDVVSGTCFSNSIYVVQAGEFGFADGPTAADGSFSVDLSDQDNLKKGDDVVIGCATHAGDFVEQEFLVK